MDDGLCYLKFSLSKSINIFRDVLSVFGWEVEVVEGWKDHLTACDGGRALGLKYSIWRVLTIFLTFNPLSYTALNGT